MADICRNSKCSTSYTAHCLRATAIQAMNDAGFELRHIMFMSGHKNESSVRSYTRECSTNQKKQISNALATITNINQIDPVIPDTSAQPPTIFRDGEFQNTNYRQPFNMPNSHLSSNNFMSSGFISNSSFQSCVFQFHTGPTTQ